MKADNKKRYLQINKKRILFRRHATNITIFFRKRHYSVRKINGCWIYNYTVMHIYDYTTYMSDKPYIYLKQADIICFSP